MFILILDDTRSIEEVLSVTAGLPNLPIVLFKDFKEAQLYLSRTSDLAAHVCLDWNLYGSKNHMNLTGYDFSKWLVYYNENRKKVLRDDFTFSCHSSDKEWNLKISEIMRSYQKEKANC